MFKFNKYYFLLAILLFGIEILIASFVDDAIIRPYIGDVLVVILIYCAVKSVFNTPYLKTAIAVLLFSYIIETLQYFNFISWVGLENSSLARVVMGTSFSWMDIVAYTVGIGIVVYMEATAARRLKKTTV